MVQPISSGANSKEVTDWYGFAVSSSSHKMSCSREKPHLAQPRKGPISNEDFLGIGYNNNSHKRKEKQPPSHLLAVNSSCMCIKTEDKSLKRIKKQVKNTLFNFKHNHTQNKQMMIKAKMATFQYIVPHEACLTILNLIHDRPIHPLDIRTFSRDMTPTARQSRHKLFSTFASNARKSKTSMAFW